MVELGGEIKLVDGFVDIVFGSSDNDARRSGGRRN